MGFYYSLDARIAGFDQGVAAVPVEEDDQSRFSYLGGPATPGGRVDPALAAGTIGSGGTDGLDSSQEISDPAADSWRIAVTAGVGRMYHSHAMTVSRPRRTCVVGDRVSEPDLVQDLAWLLGR